MLRWDGILFDLDGTLLDTSGGVVKAVDYTINEMSLTLPDSIRKTEFIGPPIYESFRKVFKLSDIETEKATNIFRNAYKDKYLFEAIPYDGIYELLSFLHNEDCRVAVATNKRIDYTLTLLRYFKLEKFFDYIEGSDFENKLRKKEIIRNCIMKLNERGDNSLIMVGDTNNDLEGAKANHIDFVGVAYGFGFDEIDQKKDIFICNSTYGLRNYLAGNEKEGNC